MKLKKSSPRTTAAAPAGSGQPSAPESLSSGRKVRRRTVAKAEPAEAPAAASEVPQTPAPEAPPPRKVPRRKTVAKAKTTALPATASPRFPKTDVAKRKPPAGIRRRKTAAVIETVAAQVAAAPVVAAPILADRPPQARKLPPGIPPILLEDDKPAPRPVSGPGQRYALGPAATVERFEAEGELPESYGTQQVLLAARDPHWLYAHWDLTAEQQRRYNALSSDRHLILRVCRDAAGSRPVAEVHVHPESRHWFIHVDRAGAQYVCELGYYAKGGGWTTLSTSGATLAPTDAMSAEVSVEFATIPYEIPLVKLVELVKEAARENVPLAQALQQLRAEGHPELPASAPPPPAAQWTPAQERALAEVISMDRVRRVWMGSLEITELIRGQFAQELASMAAAQLGAPTSPGGASVSSPFGGGQPARGFWFNVNAELIIYGATEPTATVTIGGRTIKLRPDGSFSYRFALPDGSYELPVVAVSSDQTDGRAAELQFSRKTEHRGEVGAHPQDPGLKPPAPGNV